MKKSTLVLLTNNNYKPFLKNTGAYLSYSKLPKLLNIYGGPKNWHIFCTPYNFVKC